MTRAASDGRRLADASVVITGASDGIGAVVARKLAEQGAKVTIVGRSPDKTERVAHAIGALGLVADFSSLEQVRQLSDKIYDAVDRIDVLLNNAGGAFDPTHMTPDGYEPNFQVNHLAPFLLTMRLRRLLTRGPVTSRVINTASLMHLAATAHPKDPTLPPSRFEIPLSAYASSKLMNIRFAVALNERWANQGVVAAAVHPGIVATSFGRGSRIIRAAYSTPIRRLVSIDAEKGAEPLISLAADLPTDQIAGRYFHRYRSGFPMRADALDPRLADELWNQSAQLISGL